MNKAVAQPSWWTKTRETIRVHCSPLLILSILVLPAALFLGAAIGAFNLVYGLAVAGALVMVLIVLLRMDELTVTLIIAVHLWIDWYIGLHLVGISMALVLLIAYYFGRSPDHPWVRPRLLWLWAAFLVLTIYPALNGGQFQVYDAASYYPSDVLGAFLLFCLGGLIAKDMNVIRRVFQLLSVLAALVALHTIVEATTGVFLFVTVHEDVHLVLASNYDIIGTNASRAASFFVDPNWNGCFLATMFFLPLGLFTVSESLSGKLVCLTELVLIGVALVFTYSNGSWVAFLGGVLAFMFLIGSQRRRFLWLIMILLAALLLLVVFSSELAVQLQRASGPGELSLRLGAWETGLRVIGAYPLFGVGLGGQAYLLRSYPYMVPAQLVHLNHPHDTYIQWGAMAGIPVLVLFLLLLGYGFWFSWRNWRDMNSGYRPLLGGGITALIVLSINSVSIDGWTNFMIAPLGWLVFGLLTSPLLQQYLQINRHQKRDESLA